MTAYSDRLHTYLLDQERATANDDRLFYCSYLLGHLSLVAASEPATIEQLDQQMSNSLDSAFGEDHLSDQDKAGIQALWHETREAGRR